MAETSRDSMQGDAPAVTPAASGEADRAREPLSSSAETPKRPLGRLFGRNRSPRGEHRSKHCSPRPRKAHAMKGDAGGTRQKIMIGLIPVLAIALVFIVKNPLKVSAVPRARKTPAAEAAPTPGSDVEIDWEIPPLYLPRGRDPMQLPSSAAGPVVEEPGAGPIPSPVPIELMVTGILYSADSPAAIVDTHLVHEGDQVSGATVRRIDIDGVEFEMNGRTWKQAVENQ